RRRASFFLHDDVTPRLRHSFPTRRCSDLSLAGELDDPLDVIERHERPMRLGHRFAEIQIAARLETVGGIGPAMARFHDRIEVPRSEEHTSELQSRFELVCRLLLEKKKLSL